MAVYHKHMPAPRAARPSDWLYGIIGGLLIAAAWIAFYLWNWWVFA